MQIKCFCSAAIVSKNAELKKRILHLNPFCASKKMPSYSANRIRKGKKIQNLSTEIKELQVFLQGFSFRSPAIEDSWLNETCRQRGRLVRAP